MTFLNGWLDGVYHEDAHPGRVGGPITPFAIVVHATDMPPETFGALLTSWTTKPAAGDCAHFVIGRDAAQGVVQLVSIQRNANHAGGPHHGWFVDGDGNQIHPNLCSVGIELHCAGDVMKFADGWHALDGHAPVGAVIPESDVVLDPARPGRGWQVVTPWQYEQFGILLDALDAPGVLDVAPAGLHAISPSQTPAAWAVMPPGNLATHAGLDFYDRADPHQPTCQWLRERLAKPSNRHVPRPMLGP